MDDLIALVGRPLATRWAGHPLKLVASTGSTNDDVRVAALAGAPHGYAVVADTQTAGRGRRGRTWHSPSGANLYLSFLVRTPLSPVDAPLLTLAAGVAITDALGPVLAPHVAEVKWPNDVRVAGRKLAGVLVEGSVRGSSLAFAVVGIGVNVRAVTLPEELMNLATSVEGTTGTPIARGSLLESLLRAVEERIDALHHGGRDEILAALRRRCETIGRRVEIDGVSGTAIGITDSGALEVRTGEGTVVAVRAGEVVSPAMPA